MTFILHLHSSIPSFLRSCHNYSTTRCAPRGSRYPGKRNDYNYPSYTEVNEKPRVDLAATDSMAGPDTPFRSVPNYRKPMSSGLIFFPQDALLVACRVTLLS